MTQKIFLTSALAMGFVAPAMAETFPTGGLMQENKTYDNAATETNMDGVYEGSVNAVAEYDTIDYILTAGKYLPADSETVITCPAGSYCPGISGNVQYNQSSDQGINICPTGYTSSATGSSANTDCFRQCATTDITHATAITGNVYFNGTNGDGVKECTPTACDNGYHPKAATPDLVTLIGTSEAGIGHTSNFSTGSENDTASMSNSVISGDPLAFAVDYDDKGMIKGHGRCSSQLGNNNNYTWSNPTTFATLIDETGQEGAQYCYCHLDSYTPYGSNTAVTLSGAWVFSHDSFASGKCANACAYDCAVNLKAGVKPGGEPGDLAFRAAMFDSVQSSPAMCEANVININWSNADANDISANNAGTATYGSDVRTPVKAQTIKGKTFKGWRFSKPEQTTTGN